MPAAEVPYDEQGNLLHHPSDKGWNKETDWRPNKPFTAPMTLITWARGRSAAYFIWADPQGRRFPMFMNQIHDLLMATTVQEGEVTGRWDVVKRGQNYGLRYLGEDTNA